MNKQMKYSCWAILMLSLIIHSCDSTDYSSVSGKELNIPQKIRNDRLELHASGRRTIYYIGGDFDMDKKHIDELTNRILPASTDLQSDVFVLIDRKLEEAFSAIETQVPVTVYYVDENVLNFQKTAQKRKRSFPSSLIITNPNYMIQTIQELKFNNSGSFK